MWSRQKKEEAKKEGSEVVQKERKRRRRRRKKVIWKEDVRNSPDRGSSLKRKKLEVVQREEGRVGPESQKLEVVQAEDS